jgi:hypothetical protein
MHPVHELPMPFYVLWVSVRAVPVTVLSLLSHFSFSWHKLTISKNISARALNAFFLNFFTRCRPECEIPVEIHVYLAINFIPERLLHLQKLLLLLFVQTFDLQIFFS